MHDMFAFPNFPAAIRPKGLPNNDWIRDSVDDGSDGWKQNSDMNTKTFYDFLKIRDGDPALEKLRRPETPYDIFTGLDPHFDAFHPKTYVPNMANWDHVPHFTPPWDSTFTQYNFPF